MQCVYKYPILPGRFAHQMTARADMLCVRVQQGQPQMWALVDTSAPPQPRYFIAVGTGAPIDERIISHVGTFEVEEDATAPLIFHVFEVHP
jgi:hypothetical protein